MGRSRILPTIYLVTAISKISSIIYTLNLPFFPGCNYGFAFLFYNRNLCHRIPRIFFLKIEIPRISRFFELIHSQFDEFKSNPSPLSNSNNKLNKVVFICAASLKFDLANVIQQTIKIKTWPPTPCGFVCQGSSPLPPDARFVPPRCTPTPEPRPGFLPSVDADFIPLMAMPLPVSCSILPKDGLVGLQKKILD